MRSPVGWLYFGISVICVIGVKSGVTSGSYQIIEGHSYGYPNGQIFQRVIPSVGFGYRNIGPQIQARRVNAQNYYDRDVYYGQDEERESEESNDGSEENSREDYNEEHRETHSDQHRIEEEQDQEEEDEEDLIEENSEFNFEIPSNSKNSEEEENDENEEEEEEEDDAEEEEMNQYLYGNARQANGNIKIQPNVTVHATSKNASTKIGAPSQKTPSREDRKKNNNKNKKKSKPKKSQKKKKPTQLSEEISPIKKTSQNLSKNDETNENHKENLQIRVITDSQTQFVATPIADLILRLSISLAKPVGQANGTATYIHVPVRVSNNEEKSEDKNSTASSIRDKVETLLQKLTAATVNSRPSKVVPDHPPVTEEVPATNQEIDDKKEAGEKIIQV